MVSFVLFDLISFVCFKFLKCLYVLYSRSRELTENRYSEYIQCGDKIKCFKENEVLHGSYGSGADRKKGAHATVLVRREHPHPCLRVVGLGFRLWGSGFRVQGVRFRVQGVGCGVQGLELRM